MAKNIKFAIAESGTLVYRATGNAYRGKYTTKESSNGRITVYGKDGRKIGTVGKGTLKEQRLIKEKDKKNFAKRKKSARLKAGKEDIKLALDFLGTESWDTESYQTWSIAKDENDLFPRDSWKKFEISFDDQRKMNFAKALTEGLKEGVITELQASDMWDEYLSAPTNDKWDTTRSDLWAELYELYDEMGFKYLPGD